jgi:hypothetical protein
VQLAAPQEGISSMELVRIFIIENIDINRNNRLTATL